MPTKSPPIGPTADRKLHALGQQIRARRKALRVSAVSAAEAAGMSRVTLHRIENGEPSVTMGAYLNAMAALALDFGILVPAGNDETPSVREGAEGIPAHIRLSDYPQLKRLAWHVHGIDELTPPEALGIYERNWRHLDLQAMEPREQYLVEALRAARKEGADEL